MSRRQSNELVPIPEHTSIDLTLASPRPRLTSSSSLTPEPPVDAEDELQLQPVPSIAKISRSVCVNDAKWHTMSFRELRDTLGKLKESKKVYKRQINEVESGTPKTPNNNDEESINDIYVLYKATKYKIKLIKALIEKQNK